MLAVARQSNGNLVAVGMSDDSVWHIWTYNPISELLNDHRTISTPFEQKAYSNRWRFIRHTDNSNVDFDLVPPFFGG